VDLLDWRMEKKQHMRWTRRGAQMLLHARCALLNAELGKYTRGSQAVHVKPVATRRAEGGRALFRAAHNPAEECRRLDRW
jgi:hypothetical protein